jgi:hypothetical protein
MVNSPPTSGYGAAVPYHQHYNGADPFLTEQGLALAKPTKLKNPTRGFRGFSRLDYVAMIIILLLPQLIFAAVYALVSFYFRYQYTFFAWLLVLAVFAIVAYTGYVVVSRMLQEADGINDHQAVWAAAVFLAVNVAFFAALIYGCRNYSNYMQPYYERLELNSYSDINPSTQEGRAYMDAGTVTFQAGSHLDLAKSIGFLNLNMYCVAPIVSNGTAPATYDFWAVGVNCCTGASQNFACGQPSKTNLTTGGLRLMSGGELPFFKFAVTQASTKYGVKSAHPVFFHWVQDTATALDDDRTHGLNSFLPALAFFAVFQLLLLAGAAIVVMIVKSKYKGRVIQ